MQVRKRACGFFTIASSTEETVKAGKRVITIPSKCTEAHVPTATVNHHGMASTLRMRTTISPGQWPYCGVTRVSFSARIILYKYKISYERSTYPYPKSNIFLPHSYLLSSKRSTYCLQDKLLITKNCCYICTPHRTYFRPAKKFDRTSFTRD